MSHIKNNYLVEYKIVPLLSFCFSHNYLYKRKTSSISEMNVFPRSPKTVKEIRLVDQNSSRKTHFLLEAAVKKYY